MTLAEKIKDMLPDLGIRRDSSRVQVQHIKDSKFNVKIVIEGHLNDRSLDNKDE